MKDKERLRNCSRLKEIELDDKICNPGMDSGTLKDFIETINNI